MGKQKILDDIIKFLKSGPKSINEIAKKLGVNWSTAVQNLELLGSLNKVFEKSIKNKRVFFYKDSNNYFRLPVKEEDKKLIDSIYAEIKKEWNKLIHEDPTKTQAYKAIWKVNQKLNLGLPIGWYRYGPCCVEIYQNDHIGNVSPKIKPVVKEVVKEYSKYDNFELQRQVYKEARQKLYLTKETFLESLDKDKEKFNLILMNLIKYSPGECFDTTTDFSRAILFLFKDLEELEEEIRLVFNKVWNYITLVVYKNSLDYYPLEVLECYLDEKINESKKEAQLFILDLIKNKTHQHQSSRKIKETTKKERKKIFEEFLEDESDIFGKYNLN